MIELYYFPTPNTWKASIMLEECGLPYTVKPVDIRAGEQMKPDFLAISPNNKVPAIVDLDGPDGKPLAIFESGAILVYLAEKSGKLLPAGAAARSEALQWLFWQVGGLGPMAGQAHVFRQFDPPNPTALERYVKETARLYGVMDRRLADRDYLAGEYSIADIACFGWTWFHNMHGQDLKLFPNVSAWFARLSAREAVQRGKLVGLELAPEDFRARLSGYELDVPLS
jgi:GST-like protein